MNAGDTICAIATPPGEGGIGIIRLSGEKAIDIASAVFVGSGGRTVRDYKTHTLHHGELRAPDSGERIDEVLVAVMKAPRSYTCEDVVEFHCHGGPLVLRLGLERSEEHTSELQSLTNLVCRLLLEKKKIRN